MGVVVSNPPTLALNLRPGCDSLVGHGPATHNRGVVSGGVFAHVKLANICISVIFLYRCGFGFLNTTRNRVHAILFALFILFRLFGTFGYHRLRDRDVFGRLFGGGLVLLVINYAFTLRVLVVRFTNTFFNAIPLKVRV